MKQILIDQNWARRLAVQMVVQLELSLEKQEPVGKAVPRKSNKILNSDQITNWLVVQCVLICLDITLLYICFKEAAGM